MPSGVKEKTAHDPEDHFGSAAGHVSRLLTDAEAFYIRKTSSNRSRAKLALNVAFILYIVAGLLFALSLVGALTPLSQWVAGLLGYSSGTGPGSQANVPIILLGLAYVIGTFSDRRGYRRAWARYSLTYTKIAAIKAKFNFDTSALLDEGCQGADLRRRAIEPSRVALAALEQATEEERQSWANDMQSDFAAAHHMLAGSERDVATDVAPAGATTTARTF